MSRPRGGRLRRLIARPFSCKKGPSMKAWTLSCLAAAAVLCCTPRLPGGEPPLRMLILTGQNNHAWKETTPALARILTMTGRFTVDVTEHPEQCTAESFAHCDLVLSNWNELGPVKQWPEAARTGLLDFVRRGGGFVVVHAGGTMFLDWADFQKLIGGTWGKGTGHGARHAFEVKITDQEHPITRGLPPVFQTTDELWHKMLVQPEKKVLATAFSAKDKGGTDQDEPMAMVTEFGKGRCFNLVLGHDTTAMESAGFQTLLLRGPSGRPRAGSTIAAAGPAHADPDVLLRAVVGLQVRPEPRRPRDVAEVRRLRSPAIRRPRKNLAGKTARPARRRRHARLQAVPLRQLSLVGHAGRGAGPGPAARRRRTRPAGPFRLGTHPGRRVARGPAGSGQDRPRQDEDRPDRFARCTA